MWLSGCELGKTEVVGVIPLRRYIYIHGTIDTEPQWHSQITWLYECVMKILSNYGFSTCLYACYHSRVRP